MKRFAKHWITISIILIPLAYGSICVFGENNTPRDWKGQIVFSSDRSGPWRLWKIAADGMDLHPLTAGDSDDSDVDPAFSPDGKSILFSSTRGGSVGIWRINADGSNPQRICDGDQAEWSPDGKRIAFRRNEAIWIRALENQQEKAITPRDWPHGSGPAWSPDGRRIAFACRWDAGNGIFLTTPDGGQPVKVYDQKAPVNRIGHRWLVALRNGNPHCTIQPDK